MKVAFGLGNVNDLHRTFSKEELSFKQVKSSQSLQKVGETETNYLVQSNRRVMFIFFQNYH
jgi:hypothetical protein